MIILFSQQIIIGRKVSDGVSITLSVHHRKRKVLRTDVGKRTNRTEQQYQPKRKDAIVLEREKRTTKDKGKRK